MHDRNTTKEEGRRRRKEPRPKRGRKTRAKHAQEVRVRFHARERLHQSSCLNTETAKRRKLKGARRKQPRELQHAERGPLSQKERTKISIRGRQNESQAIVKSNKNIVGIKPTRQQSAAGQGPFGREAEKCPKGQVGSGHRPQ